MTSKRITLVFGIIMDLITRPLNVVSVPVEMCRQDRIVFLAHLMLSGSSILCAGFISSTQLKHQIQTNVMLHNRYTEVCLRALCKLFLYNLIPYTKILTMQEIFTYFAASLVKRLSIYCSRLKIAQRIWRLLPHWLKCSTNFFCQFFIQHKIFMYTVLLKYVAPFKHIYLVLV